MLARDLLQLDGSAAGRSHPVLGHATVTPTMLEAGVSRNVTPPVAKAVLDVRSTPGWTHEEIAELLRTSLRSSVVVTSRRLVPCETPAGSKLLATAMRVRPESRQFGSPTCSDWVFLRHVDAIKCGPGTSQLSHTPDEYVDLPEVSAARTFYANWCAPTWRGAERSHADDTLERRLGSRSEAVPVHRGRRSAVGCPAAPLGRAGKPGARRRAAGLRPADAPESTPGCGEGCAPRFAPWTGAGSPSAPRHEDVHTAVEDWLTRREPGIGERLHTGRSRNDQVACDLRLYLKDRLLEHSCRRRRSGRRHCSPSPAGTGACSGPGTRTSAGRCRHRPACGPAPTPRDCSTPSKRLGAIWAQVDRSPLGSAAGYGVPLPLRREVVARALGFGGLDRNVATVQGGRGKLEAAVLFWCTQLGHELARLSQDVILFSAEEYGYLLLPAELATGSSIMPHKRNPDLFELTRGRAAPWRAIWSPCFRSRPSSRADTTATSSC